MRYGPQGPRVRGCGPHRAAPLPLVISVEVLLDAPPACWVLRSLIGWDDVALSVRSKTSGR